MSTGRDDFRNYSGRDLFGGHDPDAGAMPDDVSQAAPSSMRQFVRDHRRAVLGVVALVVLGLFVLVVLPEVADFGDTLDRLGDGDKTWLAIGVASEVLSIGGYIAVFRAVFSAEGGTIGWRPSYLITLAGLVATKFFAAAGAGGVVLTVWALRAAGLNGRTVAHRMAAFEILLYAVYMGALVIFGVGLAIDVFPGPSPFGMTIIPAAFGALVIALVLAMRFVPHDVEERAFGRANGGRSGRLLARLATVPKTMREGLVSALALIRHGSPWLLGAVAYWGFDIGALWASFHAFGASPPLAVLVLGYFVGMLANTIPLPGGIGGVEGGMIGALIAFGVAGSDAVLAVLTYRFISYWLPMVPGAVAYFQLRTTVAAWRERGREASDAEGDSVPATAS